MDPSIECHLKDDDVERYSMRVMSEDQSEPIEEHLLICASCRNRVEEHDFYFQGMRRAAPAAEVTGEPGRLLMMRPVWLATAASMLLAGGIAIRTGIHSPAPQAVRLEAMRGIGAKAAADRPLLLQPDLHALPAYSDYRLEIVNEIGGRVFDTRIKAAEPQATVPGVPKGVYFIRLYSPSGELLREYGVDTR